VIRDRKEYRDLPEATAQLGHKDHKDQWDPLVLTDLTEQMALTVLMVLSELLGHKDHKVTQGHKDQQDLTEQMVLTVQLVHRDLLDLSDPKDQQELMVLTEL
jgi:hypothetical protein